MGRDLSVGGAASIRGIFRLQNGKTDLGRTFEGICRPGRSFVDHPDVSAMAGKKPAMVVTSYLPWWVKLGAKLVLARLPISYRAWRRLGVFRHGEMNLPEKAISVFRSYFDRASARAPIRSGFKSLELGPGDSVLSGLVARAFGAERAWLVDAGPFADTDVDSCKKTAAILALEGRTVPDISDASSLDEVLARAGVVYLTGGTASLADIPDGSIHFFWSQVVFEHVPLDELPFLLKELRRVVSPDAVGIHGIDFRDHMQGSLNNLRFSQRTWESHAFRSSGFYTNRVRPGEMIKLFISAGFSVEVIAESRWPSLPIARRSLAQPFAAMPDEDLIVAEIELLVRPA
jgi:hypothetical protein